MKKPQKTLQKNLLCKAFEKCGIKTPRKALGPPPRVPTLCMTFFRIQVTSLKK